MPFVALIPVMLASFSPIQGFKSAAPTSKAGKMTGVQVTSKSGAVKLTVPTGWLKVDPDSETFKKAIKSSSSKISMETYEQIARMVDLMVIDLGKKAAFADNVNIVLQKLPRAIKSDTDFEDIFKQMTREPSMSSMKHKLIAFNSGPTLSYWGAYNQGASKNDLIGYVVPYSSGALVFTFSTALGKLEAFRPKAESIMQTLVIKK